MKRTDVSTRKVALYSDVGTDGASSGDGFTDGVPSIEAATILDSTVMNSVVEEIARFIEKNGVALDKTKLSQMYTAAQLDKVRQSIIRPSTVVTDTDATQQVSGLAAVSNPTSESTVAAVLVAENGETSWTSLDTLDDHWTGVSAASSYTGDFYGVTYVERLGLMVAFGSAGEIQTLAAATSSPAWTRRKNGGGNIVGVADNGSLLVAVDDAGHVWTSTNATSWTDRGALVGASAWDVAYGDGVFLVSESGQVRTSTNGTAWTTHVIAGAGQVYSTRWCSDLDLWVAATNGLIFTSPDAAAWTQRVDTDSNSASTVVVPVPGGVLVAGYEPAGSAAYAGAGYWTSGDGVTWTPGRASRFAGFDDGGLRAHPVTLLYYPTCGEYKIVAAYGASGQIRVFSAFS